MTNSISSTAEASREAHRSPDGKFGVQPASESDAELTTPGNSDLEGIMEAQGARLGAAQEAWDAADRQMVSASVIGAAAEIRNAYPQATTMVIEDDGENGIRWTALDADGNELDLHDDDQLSDQLWDWGSGINPRRASHLEEFAKGYEAGPGLPHVMNGTYQVRDGELDRIDIDIDQTLDRARPAPAGSTSTVSRADELSVGDKFVYEGELHRVASTDGDHKSLTVETEDGDFLDLGNDEQVQVHNLYRCQGCGRPEDACSADPCADVLADREA